MTLLEAQDFIKSVSKFGYKIPKGITLEKHDRKCAVSIVCTRQASSEDITYNDRITMHEAFLGECDEVIKLVLLEECMHFHYQCPYHYKSFWWKMFDAMRKLGIKMNEQYLKRGYASCRNAWRAYDIEHGD